MRGEWRAEKEDVFARLDSNCISFTTGRDITLRPAKAGLTLNYLIYPYVEVDDLAWPAEKIVRAFSVDATPTTRAVP